jgi:serine/threonine protein kinase
VAKNSRPFFYNNVMVTQNPSKIIKNTQSVSLRPGTILKNYELRKVIGFGGFSIVYMAKNKQTGKIVAIKEFYSPIYCKRLNNSRVEPISANHNHKFKLGFKRFFDEALTLSYIRHPNIVHVDNFFRANNTAYMVMPYERGKDLRWLIKQTEESPNQNILLNIFLMVLAGLKEVHEQGFLHLDIKPGNILLRSSGDPLILDLGASHRVADFIEVPEIQTLTHGYSSPEQHLYKPLARSSDLYAVAMTMYACITHRNPPSALDRCKHDRLVPLAKKYSHRYYSRTLDAIDACTAIKPSQRPQHVDEFVKMLV